MSLTKIESVDAHSPAHRAGIRAGERLTQVNGQPIVDVLDYKFYTYDARLELVLEQEDGRCRTVRLRKEEGEDLGLNFQTYLMDRARACANRCLFCFVDQMPPGLRETLYFKDDDARLSFLLGNYITLTNLSGREVQRMIDLRVSPVNISVHVTDPEVRCRLLGNRRAGECLATMTRLAKAGIRMNCQIVACPGINDGPVLARTLADLKGLWPAVSSIAVVPVGVTRYRDHLPAITPYTAQQAGAVVDLVEQFAAACRQEQNTALAWCSDEFYLLAGRTLPEKADYEELEQLENGVGMLRLLESQVALALEDPEPEGTPSAFSIATGISAAPFLQEVIDRVRAVYGKIEGTVYPIRNDFFGPTITVAGLVTGQDLIAQLSGKTLGERLLLPSSMLRAGEPVFLDDVTVKQVEEALNVSVSVVEAEDGFDLVDAILDLPRMTGSCALPPEAEYYRYNP